MRTQTDHQLLDGNGIRVTLRSVPIRPLLELIFEAERAEYESRNNGSRIIRMTPERSSYPFSHD